MLIMSVCFCFNKFESSFDFTLSTKLLLNFAGIPIEKIFVVLADCSKNSFSARNEYIISFISLGINFVNAIFCKSLSTNYA